MNPIKKFLPFMRVLILESCLRTHKCLCLTRVRNKGHSCCAKITHTAATKYPAVLPLFFEHLQHDLLSSHPLAMCNMPSCGEGCIYPGGIYFQKMILGVMTVRFQFTVPVVYPPRWLVSLSTLACDAIHATTKILQQR